MSDSTSCSIGIAVPVIFSDCASKGATNSVPCEKYARYPPGRYLPKYALGTRIFVSPVAKTVACTAAVPKKLLFTAEVYSTALAPGRNCGKRCVTSERAASKRVATCGAPPAAGTRDSPLVYCVGKMIVSSSPQ